jgi:Domain of unknown function (DUF4926)
MFEEHDVVRLKRTTTEIPLPAGSLGTIVHVYGANPPAYLVEFGDGLHEVHLYDAHAAGLEEGDNSWRDRRKHR